MYEEEEVKLKTIMQKIKYILDYEETKWRLKSRSIWLKEGDDNTKKFHNYSKQCKMFNTIWELKDI
jgi:hypothetical protein